MGEVEKKAAQGKESTAMLDALIRSGEPPDEPDETPSEAASEARPLVAAVDPDFVHTPPVRRPRPPVPGWNQAPFVPTERPGDPGDPRRGGVRVGIEIPLDDIGRVSIVPLVVALFLFTWASLD